MGSSLRGYKGMRQNGNMHERKYNQIYKWIKYGEYYYYRVDKYKWVRYDVYGDVEKRQADHDKIYANPTILDMMLDGAERLNCKPEFQVKETWPKVFMLGSYTYVFKDMDSPGRCILLGTENDKYYEVDTRRNYLNPKCFSYEIKNQTAVKAIAALVGFH